MTMVAGRMPGLLPLQRNHYEDSGAQGQGILKTRRAENARADDNRRLVRFSEASDDRPSRGEGGTSLESLITFGNNTYMVDSSDPNSAVRKLFPNSKLVPIGPLGGRNCLRSALKAPAETRPRPKSEESLLERIKRLTCEDVDKEWEFEPKPDVVKDLPKQAKEGLNLMRYRQSISRPRSPEAKVKTSPAEETRWSFLSLSRERSPEEKSKTSPKGGARRSFLSIPGERSPNVKTKSSPLEEVRRTFLSISQERSPEGKTKTSTMEGAQRSFLTLSEERSPDVKTSPTEEARRSFLSSLSQEEKPGEPRNRSSVATESTADTVYSLSDIEEALTEEEKEIKEAFANEIRQDELELFVQQGAGRTERLRRRYVGGKAEPTVKSYNFPQKLADPQPFGRREKPRFGSTVEILQQLQQQIESPYQLEGRRTACSNYSDSSMAVSDRFYEDYEPVARAIAHRTCSLDSKNYEEIESFPAFPARARSQEHPRLARLDPDPYGYPGIPNATVYHGDCPGRSLPLDNVYVSSPDLGFRAPERQLYGTQTLQRLHPVLQRQYCRYPREPEGGKVLTPPVRMHTYMNVPASAPCYSPPPPYSKAQRPHSNPPVIGVYPFDSGRQTTSRSVYQNVPAPAHSMTLRRLCPERERGERGVPEGASAQDAKENLRPQEYFLPSQVTIPKQPVPHQYCVDV